REEEAKALDRHERLDEEDEGMMTLAEMQSVLKRKKPKVKITERNRMPRSFKKGQVWA
ncbi:unnamed protein product, partial [Brassica rapa subsp. narinosa]